MDYTNTASTYPHWAASRSKKYGICVKVSTKTRASSHHDYKNTDSHTKHTQHMYMYIYTFSRYFYMAWIQCGTARFTGDLMLGARGRQGLEPWARYNHARFPHTVCALAIQPLALALHKARLTSRLASIR